MLSFLGRLSHLKGHLHSGSTIKCAQLSSWSNSSPLLIQHNSAQHHLSELIKCNIRHSSTQAALDIEETPDLNYAYYEEMIKKSLEKPDFFQVKRLVKLREMFNARVHLGHKIGTLNPHMKPYVFGSRLGHIILDLDQSVKLLEDALNFTAHIAFRNGIILFVNKSATTAHIVEKTAKNCGEYSHCRDFRMGTFTDSTTFFRAVTRLPDLVILLSTMNNVFEPHQAVKEAAKHLIPTIGVVDSNSEPNIITYPIPGNDDSIQSITYFCKVFEEAIKVGKRKRVECLQTPIVEPEKA